MAKSSKTTREYEVLVAPHLAALGRTALRLAKDASDAEDLLQDTLLRGFRFLDRFERGTNFKAWIFRILVNTFVNEYRSRRRKGPLVALDGVEPAAPASEPRDEAGLRTGGGSRVPFDAIDDRVKRALLELPDGIRDVFELAVIEDLKYREIAEVLDCPVGTVMSRLFRARALLRERLGGYAEEVGWRGESRDRSEST